MNLIKERIGHRGHGTRYPANPMGPMPDGATTSGGCTEHPLKNRCRPYGSYESYAG